MDFDTQVKRTTTWYATRLLPDSRRPRPDEMRCIFAGLGLERDFWDPPPTASDLSSIRLQQFAIYGILPAWNSRAYLPSLVMSLSLIRDCSWRGT
jgi:hypothetical protein